MKIKYLLILALSTEFIQGCGHKEASERFRIISGTYQEKVLNKVQNTANESLENGIFKIDVSTGRTWIYLDSLDLTTNGGSLTEGWREIKDVSTKDATF